MAEGNRMKTIPGEAPREDLCSAHRGTGGETSGKTHLPCNGKYVLFHKKVARNGFFGMFA